MKAVILAAGKGTRMRELTREIPKPMLQVQGRPILERIIQGLQSSGIREICIITGYRSEMVEAYFRDGSHLGVTISYVLQETQDGTGKAPELARDFAGEDNFLLSYGDILVKPETYGKMQARFAEGDFAGLVTVTPGQDVSQGGLNFFDHEFCLKKVVEKPSLEQVERYRREGLIQPGQPVWYNAGIYIFRPVLFEFTRSLRKSSRGEYELPDALNGMVLGGMRIAGLEVEGRWVDVRDPEVLAELERENEEGSL